MWSPWVCCITLLFFLEGSNCGDVIEVVAGRRSVELDDATREILQFTGYADFQPIVTEEKKATDKTPLKRKNPDIKYSVIEDIQDDDEDMDMEYGDVQDAREDDSLNRLRATDRSSTKNDRSSIKLSSKKVKPLPHQPFKDDPQGCGNPICVVLDQKPRRFPSLCQFRKWLLETSRDCQINFIQKGDCYEIIDGNGKKNEKQPWTEPLPDDNYNDICEGCRNDTNCRSKVTFNIDLQSLLEGQSSAKGGPTYQKDDDEEEGARLVGVPVEFDNICEAMKYFSKRENLNINTQVIGFGHKQKRDLLPLQGDVCLWTEWFDFQTPCLTTGEVETYRNAKNLMMEQESGPLRICDPESVVRTEYAGGSELTYVDSELVKLGKAIGNGGESFKQNIEASGYRLRCKNSENMEINQTVPAPYAYPPDKNTTCLDYKARYCCKSTDMYRPTDLDDFSQYLRYIFPIGATRIELDLSGEKVSRATMTIVSCVASKTSTEVKIVFHYSGHLKNKVIMELKRENGQTIGGSGKVVEIEGTFSIEARNETRQNIYTIVYASGKIDLRIELSTTEEGKYDAVVVSCEIFSKETESTAKVEFYPGDTATPTITTEENSAPPTQIWTTTITSGGKETYEVKIDNDGKWLSDKGPTPTYLNNIKDMWKKINQLNAELNFDYFIESPPLALLFAECDWKDYINMDSPAKKGKSHDYEFELKETAFKDKDYKKHVCENTVSNSHFIDAVTVEDQIPWYEVQLKSGEQHETLKLTPYYGYACYDGNQAGDGLCQDMKVRYCCAKQHRASWGEWEQWSKCSKTCGGGRKERKRICVQSADVDEHNTPCFGQDSNEAEYYSKQEKECNVVGCPTDYKFKGWTSWTTCSESCGKGQKTRERQCVDGENGGERCPDIFDKKKNAKSEEYEQKVYCTKADCIVPQWSHWSAWSSCSLTCGKGIQKRTRGCRTSRTFEKLPTEFCGSAQNSKEERNCRLKGCPIDGNWGEWTAWSDCNQNCIYDVDSDDPEAEKYNSKAFRKRQRYCVDPIPEYGGKGCKKGNKNEWTNVVVNLLSHEYNRKDKSGLQKQKCSIEEDSSLKYCAEDCVYSSWSEWSACSQTCMKATFEYRKDPNNEDNEKLNPIPTAIPLPLRTRVRTLLKSEKHGGSCHRSMKFVESEGGLGYDVEEINCYCCMYTDRNGKKHPQTSGDVYRENKLIPYDENKDCIPMCPYSCKWGNWKCEYDCDNPEHVQQKIKEKGLNWKFNKNENCYDVRIAKEFRNHYVETWEEFLKSIRNTKNWISTTGNLNKKLAYENPRFIKRKLKLDPQRWDRFIIDYSDLTMKLSRRTPQGKIIDPVFGGTSCSKEEYGDKYYLTRIKPDDKQAIGWDRLGQKEDTLVYEIDEFYEAEKVLGQCELPLCYPKFKGTEQQPTEACSGYMWTRWGEWGQCDLQCGSKGLRKRKRKCTTCGDPNGREKPNGCKPSWVRPGLRGSEEGLKDEDTAACSPCPSESLVGWADWEGWSAPDSTECGTRVKQYRVRKCNDDFIEALAKEGDQERCASKHERGGVERESRTLNMPPCGNVAPEVARNPEPEGLRRSLPELAGNTIAEPEGRRGRRRGKGRRRSRSRNKQNKKRG